MTGKAEKSRKTVVITGATSGMGLAAVRLFARSGDFVIGISHSESKCRRTARRLREENPGARIVYICADLSIMAQVRRAAAEVKQLLAQDGYAAQAGEYVLINNAATVPSHRRATADGYEMQLAVNHLAGFLLTCDLLPVLSTAEEGRVITVSSRSHRWGRIHWDDPHLRQQYTPLQAYGQAKLANILFTQELNNRLPEDSCVRAIAFDPGLIRTDIGHKNAYGLAFHAWSLRRMTGRPPEEAAAWLRHLAYAPREDIEQGCLWKKGRLVKPGKRAGDEEAARRLWRLSEELSGCDTERVFAALR